MLVVAGCPHTVATTLVLEAAASRAAAAAHPDLAQALLDLAGGRIGDIAGTHVTRAARAHDPLAIELLADLGTWIGAGATTLTTILDPDIIVIGGGVAHAGPLLLGPVQTAFADAPGRAGHPPIVAAHLGNTAGIIGSADLSRTPIPASTPA